MARNVFVKPDSKFIECNHVCNLQAKSFSSLRAKDQMNFSDFSEIKKFRAIECYFVLSDSKIKNTDLRPFS